MPVNLTNDQQQYNNYRSICEIGIAVSAGTREYQAKNGIVGEARNPYPTKHHEPEFK